MRISEGRCLRRSIASAASACTRQFAEGARADTAPIAQRTVAIETAAVWPMGRDIAYLM